MNVIKFFLLSFVFILLNLGLVPYAKSSLASTNHAQSVLWGYSGENDASRWGELHPEFATCKTGNQQSPIDLKVTTQANMSPIEFNYKNTLVKVINKGHTLEVKYEPGSSISISGRRYELLQFHFHAPSEHTVDGNVYPMEVHLVHKSQDGKLAVIGVFIKEGKRNDFIETLWANIPLEEGKKILRGVSINASVLPLADKPYYHYSGSLTTPPCSEGVNWNILQTPIEVSQEQIKRFTSIYNGNARPVQPLNRRIIEFKE